ncbi:hypothetical protein HPB52_020400 [Rhipicephalus sanguineus]|uniref:Reelin domain-containing protein n=1 Tax=Rhipicephalus sanguineus TaxID=34632 RepID=A0A9D4PD61_RHISA|nr:hypothetical protein HPB52_020400 [Rhipicephalus sanguineus]
MPHLSLTIMCMFRPLQCTGRSFLLKGGRVHGPILSLLRTAVGGCSSDVFCGNGTVLLVGTFKGFLIKAVNKDGGLVSGKFAIDNSFMKGVDCDGHKDSAVTHVNNSEKSSVSVTWTAPDSFTGDVMFRATVVRTKPDFYVGLMSSAVKIQAPSPSDNHKSDKDGKTGKQDSSATSLYGLPVWPLALVLSCVALNARHWLAFP